MGLGRFEAASRLISFGRVRGTPPGIADKLSRLVAAAEPVPRLQPVWGHTRDTIDDPDEASGLEPAPVQRLSNRPAWTRTRDTRIMRPDRSPLGAVCWLCCVLLDALRHRGFAQFWRRGTERHRGRSSLRDHRSQHEQVASVGLRIGPARSRAASWVARATGDPCRCGRPLNPQRGCNAVMASG
jgi:hypothetical protein